MTYWSYNADTRTFALYGRGPVNIVLFETTLFDFEQAHALAAAVDKIYEHGIAAGREDISSKVQSVLQQSAGPLR